MSSPQRWPVTEQLVLRCDRCPAAWASEVYDVGTFDTGLEELMKDIRIFQAVIATRSMRIKSQ